jgi:hypothetical protein
MNVDIHRLGRLGKLSYRDVVARITCREKGQRDYVKSFCRRL